jgi:hypothetical protein
LGLRGGVGGVTPPPPPPNSTPSKATDNILDLNADMAQSKVFVDLFRVTLKGDLWDLFFWALLEMLLRPSN